MKKSLMKFAAAKPLKTVKYMPTIFFNIVITDLCLLPCYYIIFKRWLDSVTKVFMSKVVLANFQVWEPTDA